MPVSKNLLQRLKERITTYFGNDDAHAPDGDLDRGPASGVDQIMYRIRKGARERTKLWVKYNNTWRHLEPYSFRYRSKGMQPLFYAWCELHDEIHSFRIDRIQDIHNTDRPFAPRHDVEID